MFDAYTSTSFLVLVVQVLQNLPPLVVTALLLIFNGTESVDRMGRVRALVPFARQFKFSDTNTHALFFLKLILYIGLYTTAGTIMRSLPSADTGVRSEDWYDMVTWMLPTSTMLMMLTMVIQFGVRHMSMSACVTALFFSAITFGLNLTILIVSNAYLDAYLAFALFIYPTFASLVIAILFAMQCYLGPEVVPHSSEMSADSDTDTPTEDIVKSDPPSETDGLIARESTPAALDIMDA